MLNKNKELNNMRTNKKELTKELIKVTKKYLKYEDRNKWIRMSATEFNNWNKVSYEMQELTKTLKENYGIKVSLGKKEITTFNIVEVGLKN
jgi:hypothetical protein